MANLRKRIEALEEQANRRFVNRNCICHPSLFAMFHTSEEADEARRIPCPIHGIPRFRTSFITLNLRDALMPAERHLCHCEPMRERTAIEQGRTLTPEEAKLGKQEYLDWYNRRTLAVIKAEQQESERRRQANGQN